MLRARCSPLWGGLGSWCPGPGADPGHRPPPPTATATTAVSDRSRSHHRRRPCSAAIAARQLPATAPPPPAKSRDTSWKLRASGLPLPNLAKLVFPPGKLPELTVGSMASFWLLQALAKNFIDKAARERTVNSAGELRLSWIRADGLTARSMTLLCPTVVIWSILLPAPPPHLSRAPFRLLVRVIPLLPFPPLFKQTKSVYVKIFLERVKHSVRVRPSNTGLLYRHLGPSAPAPQPKDFHLHVHLSPVQQTFIEHLLSSSHNAGFWRHRDEQSRHCPCPHKAQITSGEKIHRTEKVHP